MANLYMLYIYVQDNRVTKPARPRPQVLIFFQPCSSSHVALALALRRQKFAEGGPKISEHDLETWMVILRGRVRGRGGGEVQEGDVEWAVNTWKEGRANVE